MKAIVPAEPCTCGGGGICTRCAEKTDSLGLEASLMVRALDRLEQAMLAPVIPLDRHSVRVPKDAA